MSSFRRLLVSVRNKKNIMVIHRMAKSNILVIRLEIPVIRIFCKNVTSIDKISNIPVLFTICCVILTPLAPVYTEKP